MAAHKGVAESSLRGDSMETKQKCREKASRCHLSGRYRWLANSTMLVPEVSPIALATQPLLRGLWV